MLLLKVIYIFTSHSILHIIKFSKIISYIYIYI